MKKLITILTGIALSAAVIATGTYGLTQENIDIYERAAAIDSSVTGFEDFSMTDYPVAFYDGEYDYVLTWEKGGYRIDKRAPVISSVAATAYPVDDHYEVLVQLVEQGKLDLQTDIKTYLPDGFLKNLTSDKPITMLDLMTHQAGFQETYFIQTANAEDMVSLEEALSSHQPKQIYEPGEYTAYSNWGAALAAFIVQRVSGMDYAEYVQQNIFEPLGMEHTSIGAVYEDNVWVKEQREKLACYYTDGEKIPGKGMYYIYLYPAGSAAGTISDLLTFAQAITPNQNADCPLFEKQETLDQLYTAASYYGTSGVPNNYHGFRGLGYRLEKHG